MIPARAAKRLALAASVVWVAGGPAALAAAADSCPFPLGDYLVNGDVRVVSGSPDAPDSLASDVSWVGALFSEGRFATDGSRVMFAYESEYEFLPYNSTLKSESHIVGYKEFSTRTGWDTRPQFVSSYDVGQPMPAASSSFPTIAVVGQDVWVAWSIGGSVRGTSGRVNPAPFWPDSGAYIVFRGLHDGTWGPISPLSDLGPVAVNLRVTSASLRSGAFFAYQTNARESGGDQFHIVGRPFDGRTLGLAEAVSTPFDGWSDETVALATDGNRVAAAWTSRNATDFYNGSTRAVLRVREPGGAWGDEIVVSPPGESYVRNPEVAFHDNKWFVAWSAVDPQASPGGDSSIIMRYFDTETGALSPVFFVTDASLPGTEDNVALASYGGRLFIAWSSNSDLGGSGTVSSRLDIQSRKWDGQGLSPVTSMGERPADSDVAIWPGYFKVGGALFATYGVNPNRNGLGQQNQREVVRLLERPARFEDNLTATFAVRLVTTPTNSTLRVNLRFLVSGRTANESQHYALRLGDGTLIRLPQGPAEVNISIPFRGGAFNAPTEAYWCGEPVPIRQQAWPFPVPPPANWLTSLSTLVPALLGAAVLSAVAIRVRRSRARAATRRKARATPEDQRAADDPKGARKP